MMEDCGEGILLAWQGWESLRTEGWLLTTGCRHGYLDLWREQAKVNRSMLYNKLVIQLNSNGHSKLVRKFPIVIAYFKVFNFSELLRVPYRFHIGVFYGCFTISKFTLHLSLYFVPSYFSVGNWACCFTGIHEITDQTPMSCKGDLPE